MEKKQKEKQKPAKIEQENKTPEKQQENPDKLAENVSGKITKKIEKREKVSFYAGISRIFKVHLSKAGIEADHGKISRSILYFAIFLNILVSIYVVFYLSIKYSYPIWYIGVLMLFLWLFIFLILIAALYLLFFVALDFKIFKRTQDIEEVLPDFLELTSANIRAGMPIDQALWFAVRPRFGVLAKEIETVAKETLSGEDLEVALRKFTAKYNSNVLDRSINLLIEGMTAGGELGYLLNRISSNIQESRILRREMSANVTAYVIFISFASIIAAPVLFALSGQLLVIVSGLIKKMATISKSGATTGVSINPAGAGISFGDFQIFSIILLIITAFFSSIIIAIIKKGDIKSGVSYIPRFIIVSMIVYWIATKILAQVLGGFF